jgi:Holliday junction resolvase-like predicted endonuclease
MSHVFKESLGPRSEMVAKGFADLAEGEAFARAYFERLGYAIIDCEYDKENDAIDFATERGKNIFIFMVEKEKN